MTLIKTTSTIGLLLLLGACAVSDSDGSSSGDRDASGETEGDVNWRGEVGTDATDVSGSCVPLRDGSCCDGDAWYGEPVCVDDQWVCEEGEVFGSGCPDLPWDMGRDRDVYEETYDEETYDGGSCESEPVPPSDASLQTVTFVVTNQSDAIRYVGTAGMGCDAYAITGVEGGAVGRLAQSVGFTCPCECPAPQSPYVGKYATLGPGESTELVWDARSMQVHSRAVDCGEMGWPGMECQSEPAGVWSPVTAGFYQVSLVVEQSVPETCWEDEESLWCDSEYGEPDLSFSSTQDFCGEEGGLVVSQDFELPSSGNLEVAVTLN